MVDRVSKETRSKIMSSIRSRDTKPEIILRKYLWSKGLRFRVNYSAEKIDIAFPSKKIALFVDGCFWHSCPIHSHEPKSNKSYWLPKLQKNKERDFKKNQLLAKQGWAVIRIWEHELCDMPSIIEKIEKATQNESRKDFNRKM
jgi:DNA mismatch endonuclease (patch repair protein)